MFNWDREKQSNEENSKFREHLKFDMKLEIIDKSLNLKTIFPYFSSLL